MFMQQFDKEKGIVLVIVLLLLHIISLLGIYMLESSKSEVRMNRNSWQRSQALRMTEAALSDVEAKLMQHLPVCFINITPSDILFSRSLSWWKSSATCTGNFQTIRYYYVLEALEKNPCAYIDAPKTVAKYYRISLLSIFSPTNSIIRLQSTVILPVSGDAADCTEIQYPARVGRQMWRELF